MSDPADDVGRSSTLSRVGEVVLVGGLALIAASLVIPFASNEAGCLDHCADAGSYFVWHPFHNPGAPFLLVGVVSSLLLWRSAEWRRRPVTWLGTLAGWLGLWILDEYAPAVIEELALYGGPELELHPSRRIVFYGWLVLQVGVVLYALGRPAGAEPATS